MDLLNTLKGSLLEGFFPAGWDLAKIDGCCSYAPEKVTERQDFWNKISYLSNVKIYMISI